MEIDPQLLEALLNRAGREEPRTPEEQDAVHDGWSLLRADRETVAEASLNSGWVQPQLFDTGPYER